MEEMTADLKSKLEKFGYADAPLEGVIKFTVYNNGIGSEIFNGLRNNFLDERAEMKTIASYLECDDSVPGKDFASGEAIELGEKEETEDHGGYVLSFPTRFPGPEYLVFEDEDVTYLLGSVTLQVQKNEDDFAIPTITSDLMYGVGKYNRLILIEAVPDRVIVYELNFGDNQAEFEPVRDAKLGTLLDLIEEEILP